MISPEDYEELLARLAIDIPAAVPELVKYSGSVAQPAAGSTLVWDANQKLYVPTTKPVGAVGLVTSGVGGFTANAFNEIPFNTQDANNVGFSFGSFGAFTCPANGWYLLEGTLGINTGTNADGTIMLSVFENATEFYRGGRIGMAASSFDSVGLSCHKWLTSGRVYTLQLWVSFTTTALESDDSKMRKHRFSVGQL